MITIGEAGLRAKSKKEMYRFLATECKVYLPPIREANHIYIADVMEGKKKVSITYKHYVS
jgi:hypothetical protein